MFIFFGVVVLVIEEDVVVDVDKLCVLFIIYLEGYLFDCEEVK